MEQRRDGVADANAQASVSTLRLYVLRLLYLLLVVMLGSDVWPVLIGAAAGIRPLEGVAYSFWGALSLLGLMGMRYPLKMLPLVLTQFCYKAIWVLAIFLPLRHAGVPISEGLTRAMIGGLVVDLAAIPWPFVVRQYLRAPGEPWRAIAPTTR